jgi:hypothetical protein
VAVGSGVFVGVAVAVGCKVTDAVDVTAEGTGVAGGGRDGRAAVGESWPLQAARRRRIRVKDR